MDYAAIGVAAAASDFSFIALFMKADVVVKTVMIMLVVASIWSWAIVIDKQMQFGALRKQARRFEEAFWAGRSLEELAASMGDGPREPMARIFSAAMREWRESRARGAAGRDGGSILSLTERIDRVMGLVVSRELSRVEQGLGILASVGSASPFIGLFGTVWGIMNAFRSIAASNDTSLAVVAPPIAEALFATALGLLAAIPAVIFYNKFSTDLSKFAAQLEGYADELSAILSRRAQERVG